MKWILKALLQRGLSALPDPNKWNYFFQRKVSKTLPVSDEVFFERFQYAYERLAIFQEYGTKPIEQLRCFEFGAGWDLAGPIAYFSMGINHQLLVDIRPGVRLELINDQLDKLARHIPELERVYGRSLRRPAVTTINSISELKQHFGIEYRAPADARSTGLPDNSIDFISTNSTLEHIPEEDVQKILIECHRIITEEGLMVHFVDMKDHYAYFDSSVSVYNFLSLGTFAWFIINSDLQYQNRLRISDYRKMFERARFGIVKEMITWPEATELAALRSLKLLPQFQRYSESDLSAKIAGFVTRRK
jgi:hypothetical protein